MAEQQVQAAINAAATFLPTDLPNPPIYNKTNPADAPILTLALSSATMPLPKVEDLAETRLAQKISQQRRASAWSSISGGQKPGVRVRVNPAELPCPADSISKTCAPRSWPPTSTRPKGNFDGRRQLAYTIAANDQLLQAKDYQSLVIAYRPTGPVMLSDVAQAVDDVENLRQAAWMGKAGVDGGPPTFTPAVIMNIQRQPGANIIEVVDRIKRLLPNLSSNLPASVKIDILTDRTTTIRASVEDVQFELMLTIGLVVLVIFLFLQHAFAGHRASPVWPGAAFARRHVCRHVHAEFQLEQPDLDGTHHLDGVRRRRRHRDDRKHCPLHVEQGEKPLQAALKGSAEIGFTIISLSISLIAVLIPLLFMGDIVGRAVPRVCRHVERHHPLFRQVVSLTLTPMMAARPAQA